MAEKKFNLSIKSDGTSKGTSLMVNGSDITKTMNVTYISFGCYSDGTIWANWSVVEKDDKNIEKRSSYTYNGPESPNALVKRSSESTSIGKDSEVQFASDQDSAAYKLTNTLRKLTDVVEVKTQIEG